MFLQVFSLDAQGNRQPKHINLLNVSLIHNIQKDNIHNQGKFLSVLYTSNGYAVYSYLTAEQIVTYMQESVVTEDDVIKSQGE